MPVPGADGEQDGAGDRNIGKWIRSRKTAIRENIDDRDQRAVTIALLSACVVLVGMLVYWIVVLTELPSADDLRKSRFERATVVYSTDGVELTSYQDKNRRWVKLEEISPWVSKALIATEDHRFYEHSGIDVVRTLGSVFRTLGGDMQGGSTITMQFARNAFPDIYDDWILTRKIKEWITSLRIEGMYEKDEILEMYLNTVPFMYNAFGIEAGSRTYFQLPASELNLRGASTLVGMLKGTVYYNPVRHPERSHERRNTVLWQMVKHGYLEESEFEAVRDQPTRLNFKRLSRSDEPAPHFAEFLRQWLDDWAERYSINLYTDGLRVHTTIDSRLQTAAQAAVDAVGNDLQGVADRNGFDYFWRRNPDLIVSFIRQTERFRTLRTSGLDEGAAVDSLRQNEAFSDSLRRTIERVQAGFVAVSPQNGHVAAWVGGRDFGEVQFDHVAMSKRQPGSTFKPFVYAAALANGFSATSVIRDEKVEYVDPDTRRRWAPQNVGEASGRLISLKDALAYSKNIVTAQLTMEIGPGTVADYARRMGIRSDLDEVPSIGLGTSEVSLLELAGAYGTIAGYGRHREPVFVTRIEDNSGNVIAQFSGESRQAIPASVAYSVIDMLRGVADYGTGVRIRNQYGVRDDVAAKTGTSQNGADGWFMLMHPNLVMGAWVGFVTPSIYFRSDYWAQGSRTALPIVGKFYQAAKRSAGGVLTSDARFNPPPGWVEPQPFDTTGRSPDDEYYQYAAYLDSLGQSRDSLVRGRDDSTWRFDYDSDEEFDELEDDSLDLEPERPPEERDIEDVETADSLNRRERRAPRWNREQSDGGNRRDDRQERRSDGDTTRSGGDSADERRGGRGSGGEGARTTGEAGASDNGGDSGAPRDSTQL